MLWFIGISALIALILHLNDLNEARHREAEKSRLKVPDWMERPGWGSAEQKRWEQRWVRRFFIFLAICVLILIISAGGMRPPSSRYM